AVVGAGGVGFAVFAPVGVGGVVDGAVAGRLIGRDRQGVGGELLQVHVRPVLVVPHALVRGLIEGRTDVQVGALQDGVAPGLDAAPLGLEAAPLAVDAFVPAAGELRIELPNTWCGRDLVQCTRRGLVDRVDHAGLLHRHSVVFQQGMPGGEHVVI